MVGPFLSHTRALSLLPALLCLVVGGLGLNACYLPASFLGKVVEVMFWGWVLAGGESDDEYLGVSELRKVVDASLELSSVWSVRLGVRW